ncbi:TIGR01777 family oxidoreductase [Acanthopleuribacter pedis]|uniref:TIGR01777 family oxidoreductase n=1 Tax=Acanthopleuribacter pedis TaxID=442870 RepID=A0A8J7QHQ7_9BACT|nr:TIGR01777 family oxidoreductase [Acanthopleuribacter pedis]MBO1320756.1 TIGR01777 family oxidoreductase [Acanthopleuribacter pedis]
MKVVIAGGAGALGRLLCAWFSEHHITVLSRREGAFDGPRWVHWDGETTGAWTQALEGADVLINLAGRSVDCRYHAANRRQIMDSRVLSTAVLGKALAGLQQPPKLWLQMSTATIYADCYGEPHDERGGILGGHEPNAPDSWRFSIEVAKAWEATAHHAKPAATRLVLLRTAMVMSADGAGAFGVLAGLAAKGLGGRAGSGRQYVSWIHEKDFCRAVAYLVETPTIQGPVILAAPEPLPNRAFMKTLRDALKAPFGIPAPAWLIEIASFFMRTESELILKSRRVFPLKLLENGFSFTFPGWGEACRELIARRGSRGNNAGSDAANQVTLSAAKPSKAG